MENASDPRVSISVSLDQAFPSEYGRRAWENKSASHELMFRYFQASQRVVQSLIPYIATRFELSQQFPGSSLAQICLHVRLTVSGTVSTARDEKTVSSATGTAPRKETLDGESLVRNVRE